MAKRRDEMSGLELVELAKRRFQGSVDGLELYFETVRQFLPDMISKKPFFEDIYNKAIEYKIKYATVDIDTALKFSDIAKKTAHALAQDYFHYYLLYVEWNRVPEKKFYPPRMKALRVVVDDLQDLADGVIKLLTVSLPPRIGKLVADEIPVLTRDGWKTHGELAVGDYVISPNGTFVPVTYVFPKNYANTRVRFTDGTFIDVHENHEWLVYNRHAQKYCIMETKQMAEDFQDGSEKIRGHRYHYMLPPKNYLIGEYKRLPVEPYTFGAWLGDGRNNNPDICGDKDDVAIVERIIADGYAISWHTTHKDTGVKYYGFKELRKPLQQLGMCHSRKRLPKHIPAEYLTARFDQRLHLLAGLLDTDGCLMRKERRYQFTTAEEQLKEDFISLVSTFGWRCSVQEIEPHTSSSGIRGKHRYWVIGFNPNCYIPCQLERKQLKEFSKQRRIAVSDIENIEPKQGNCISVEGGVYCVGKRLTPTHNSTLGIFFLTWLMGKYPDLANLMSGHSDTLTKGFYKEVLSILLDEEYLWGDVFPDCKIAATSAEDESICINKQRRFPTLTCRAIEGTLTGAVEVAKLLYVDDIIKDLEEALSPQRLQNKYNAYLNQLKDRKKDGAMELHIGTRWAVTDVIGKLKEQYKDDPTVRFRVVPALNENGESNFDYPYGLGFSTAYYEDMKASIDPAEWNAKYMGDPQPREGLLFPQTELNFYNGVLPDGAPDVTTVCDVAFGGGDSLSSPIIYWYGDVGYVHDWVFNRGAKNITQPLIVAAYHRHKIIKARFEANAGGDVYADNIREQLKKIGDRPYIYSKRADTKMGKMARIQRDAPDIKKMLYFRNDKKRGKEYDAAMNELTRYTITASKQHDDAPDSLSMAVDEHLNGISELMVVDRPC